MRVQQSSPTLPQDPLPPPALTKSTPSPNLLTSLPTPPHPRQRFPLLRTQLPPVPRNPQNRCHRHIPLRPLPKKPKLPTRTNIHVHRPQHLQRTDRVRGEEVTEEAAERGVGVERAQQTVGVGEEVDADCVAVGVDELRGCEPGLVMG